MAGSEIIIPEDARRLLRMPREDPGDHRSKIAVLLHRGLLFGSGSSVTSDAR